MNTIQPSMAVSAVAALSTFAFAGAPSAVTEDYSSGTGTTSSFSAFAGTPAQSQITSPGPIWIGDVLGLITELDNPFYNDTAQLPAGTPVLAFGPSNLNPFVEIIFSVEVSHADFLIYDIETADAVRVLGFNDQGAEIYNSGTLNGDSQFQSLFSTEFDPPVRELLIEAVNQDGLMLSPINILYNEINTCPADLAPPFDVLNLQDVFAYLALFNSQDPSADLAAPFEVFNLQDVFAYLGLFNAGCPSS